MPDISNGKHVQAMKLAESSHVHSPLVAGGIYGNLGAAHMFMADYEAAAGLLEPARAIAHDNQDRVSLSKALANLGTVYQVFSAATLLKSSNSSSLFLSPLAAGGLQMLILSAG